MYEIREAREEDRESSVEMLIRAFKDIDSFEETWVESWKKYMNRPEYEDWNYVATHNGQVVANLAFFANSNNVIRGGPVRFGGIWAVATDANHRRKGLLRRIFEQTFRSMKDKGITLSILEPSPYEGAQPAYERMGYEVVEKRVHHEFSAGGLRPLEINDAVKVRLIDNEKDWKMIAELEKSMSRYGSTVLTWSGFLIEGIKAKNFYVFEQEGDPVGCVNLGFVKKDAGNEVYMMNVYFTSENVLPSILKLVQERVSADSKVIWNCTPKIPVRIFFQHVHSLHTRIEGEMMMRVVDFEGYCNSIMVSDESREEIVLKIVDNECPWNANTYNIKCNKRALTIAQVDNTPDVTLTSNELSRVVGGYESPVVLQKLGLIRCEPEVAKKLDIIFPQDSFISYFRF